MSEYQDFDGNPCSLHSLCIAEPEWAVNHIERLTADNERLRAALEDIVDDYKTPMNRDAVKAFGLVKRKAAQALAAVEDKT